MPDVKQTTTTAPTDVAKHTVTSANQLGSQQEKTSGISGALNISQGDREKLTKIIMENFSKHGGGTGGVAKLTPEMTQSLNRLKQTGQLDAMSAGLLTEGKAALGSVDAAKKALTQVAGNKLTPEQINATAQHMINSPLIKQEVQQLQTASKEGLQGALSQLEDTSAQQGSLGSSRAALARGLATSESQKALQQNVQGVLAREYGRAQDQAQQLNQQQVQNQLAASQGFQGLAGTGMQMQQGGAQAGQQTIENLLKTGSITQEQANKLYASGAQNINQVLQQLGTLGGVAGAQSSVGKTTQLGDTTEDVSGRTTGGTSTSTAHEGSMHKEDYLKLFTGLAADTAAEAGTDYIKGLFTK